MLSYALPQPFRQWIRPSFGLCSRELFGGSRKFFFTLRVIFVCLRKGNFFVFSIACLVVYSVSTDYKNTVFGAWYTTKQPETEGRKEGIGDLDWQRLSLWCRRCGTAPCPTPARIPTKSGWKPIIKGKKSPLCQIVMGLVINSSSSGFRFKS